MNTFVIAILLSILTPSIWSFSAVVGDSCTNKGQSGVCKLLDACPTAIRLLRKGIFPKTCNFQGTQSIVCCSEEISAKEKCQALIDWRRADGGGSYVAGRQLEYQLVEDWRDATIDVTLVGGGDKTLADEFPHMVKYTGGEVKWVLLGALLLDDPKKTNATRFAVKEVFAHPKYTPPSHYDDIALLKLEDKVVPSNSIYPACLYTEQTVPNQPLIATGWGKMSNSGEGSNHLLKVNLDHVDSGSCNSAYSTISRRKLNNGISKYTQICAGGTVGKDTCEGDSGGPLQLKSRYGNTYEIVGVTSFGKICTVTSSPGVYTKVAGFLDWIEPIVWNE